ncbi:hypothetical protein H1R20_g2898, partial [Candolleomyces eurysporus]
MSFNRAIANQGSLSGLETETRKIEGRLKEIVGDSRLEKSDLPKLTVRPPYSMDVPSNSTTVLLVSLNYRVPGFAWFTICALTALGPWQIFRPHAYFKRKYLIVRVCILGTANFSSDVHNYNISAPPGDEDETEDKLIEQICEWLTNVSFGSIYSGSHSKATEGTGMWLIESEEFGRWKRGGFKILWGTGKPGAGKTTLSSIVIQHLQKDDVACHAPVIFAFCRYTEKYSPSEIFASWIQQLLRRDRSTLEHVCESFRIHERDGSRPSNAELHKLMSAVVQKFDRVFIILDGLDEAEEDARKPLLDFINSLPSNTHTLIMSRPLESLQRLFPCVVHVDIEARNEDIERFVEKRILDIPSLHAVLLGKDAAKEDLCTAIKRKSGGMFLIASLQIEAVKSCISVQSLMKKLETLPIGLNELYDHTLERIEAQGQEKSFLAKRVLLWVTYALHPLSIGALQEAVAIELDSETFDANCMSPIELLLDVCCGLVTLDARGPEQKGVRLIRLTPLAWAAHNSDEAMVRRILLHPNLNINARNPWTGYTALMQASGELDLPGTSVVELLMSHPNIDINLGPRCGCTPLIVSTYRNRSGVISKLISHPHINIHARCNTAGTALSIAADQIASDWTFRESCNSCSELVLARETILRNADEDDIHHYLQITSCLGFQDMATELISKTKIRPTAAALVKAAKAGFASAVEMLLEHVDVNAEDSTGCTALSAAVMKGCSSTVDLFLSRPDILVNKGSIPPLIRAIESEAGNLSILFNPLSSTNSRLPHTHTPIARQLLRRTDIDINVFDSIGRVPLTCAMEAECWETVDLLLSRPDLDVNQGEPPALVQACLKGREALVRKLLAIDCLDMNAVDATGRSALSMAAYIGHRQIAKLLLSRPDVNVNVGSPTPLMHACHQGHAGIVELLLTSHGDELDINLRAESYECRPTALWFACFSDRPNSDIIKLLLQRSDIDVNIGLTIGHAACKCAKTLTSKRLLDHRQLPTPLHVAALQQEDAVPLLLTSPRINVNALNMDGKTPFMVHLEFTPLVLRRRPTDSFLSHPAVLEEPFGSRALISAAATGDLKEKKLNEIKTILSRSRMIDVNFLEPNGRSVLSAAAFQGSTKIVAFLLSLPSIDPNSGNPPPLAQASICRRNPSVLRLLLEHPNIDLNRETDGYTALGGACATHHHDRITLNSVKLLLS